MTKQIQNTKYQIPNTLRKLLPLVALLLVFGLYLYNLTAFPIFADEAIYLHWAKRISQGDENVFLSMFDGKPPLFIWVSILFYKLSNQLLGAGRLVSVLAVMAGTLGLFYILKWQGYSKWAWFSLVLLVSSPFIFFHSRLALMDTLLSSLLLLGVVVWTLPKLPYRGLWTGLAFGLAFMTKTPALFLFPLPGLLWLLWERNRKGFWDVGIATTLMAVSGLLLKTSVWFPNLFLRSEDFTFSLSELLHGRWDHILPNLFHWYEWLSWYQTPFIFLLAVIGMVIGSVKRHRLIINLGLALLLFAAPFWLLGKVIAPRYYLLTAMIVVVLAAYALMKLPKKGEWLGLFIILSFFWHWNWTLLTRPLEISLPETDKNQYLQDWSSGIGLREAAAFFKEEGRKQPVKVLTEGYFGTLPDGLFVMLDPLTTRDQLEVIGVGSVDSANFAKEFQNRKTNAIYYIGNANRISPGDRDRLGLVQSYPKVEGGPALEVHRIIK